MHINHWTLLGIDLALIATMQSYDLKSDKNKILGIPTRILFLMGTGFTLGGLVSEFRNRRKCNCDNSYTFI